MKPAYDPDVERLTPEDFELHPEWAKQTFALRLFCLFFPPVITRALRRARWRAIPPRPILEEPVAVPPEEPTEEPPEEPIEEPLIYPPGGPPVLPPDKPGFPPIVPPVPPGPPGPPPPGEPTPPPIVPLIPPGPPIPGPPPLPVPDKPPIPLPPGPPPSPEPPELPSIPPGEPVPPAPLPEVPPPLDEKPPEPPEPTKAEKDMTALEWIVLFAFTRKPTKKQLDDWDLTEYEYTVLLSEPLKWEDNSPIEFPDDRPRVPFSGMPPWEWSTKGKKGKPIFFYWEFWGETLCANHEWTIQPRFTPLATCPTLPFADSTSTVQITNGALHMHQFNPSSEDYLYVQWDSAASGEPGPVVANFLFKCAITHGPLDVDAYVRIFLRDLLGKYVSLYIAAGADVWIDPFSRLVGDNSGERQMHDLTAFGMSGTIDRVLLHLRGWNTNWNLSVDYLTFPGF